MDGESKTAEIQIEDIESSIEKEKKVEMVENASSPKNPKKVRLKLSRFKRKSMGENSEMPPKGPKRNKSPNGVKKSPTRGKRKLKIKTNNSISIQSPS